MQHLSPDSEHHSPNQHDPERILVAADAEDEVAQHAEHGGDDQHDPRPVLIDHDASQERDDDVGEGVQSVEEVELELADVVAVLRQVLLDGFLQRLASGILTLALSKQYSQPNTTKMAITTTMYRMLLCR
jgi:hypothetical protein